MSSHGADRPKGNVDGHDAHVDGLDGYAHALFDELHGAMHGQRANVLKTTMAAVRRIWRLREAWYRRMVACLVSVLMLHLVILLRLLILKL